MRLIRSRDRCTFGIAMGDDVLGQRRPQPRDMGQKRRRGGVQIDADRVHRILDHGLKGAGQLALIDIVLILADTDRFRRHLDQLGQRVLQTPGNRRAAQRHVQIGKFLRRQFEAE